MKKCFFVTVDLPKGITPEKATANIMRRLRGLPVVSVKFRDSRGTSTSLPQEWTDLHEQITEGEKP